MCVWEASGSITSEKERFPASAAECRTVYNAGQGQVVAVESLWSVPGKEVVALDSSMWRCSR